MTKKMQDIHLILAAFEASPTEASLRIIILCNTDFLTPQPYTEGRKDKDFYVAEFVKNLVFSREIIQFRNSWRIPLRCIPTSKIVYPSSSSKAGKRTILYAGLTNRPMLAKYVRSFVGHSIGMSFRRGGATNRCLNLSPWRSIPNE